MLCLDHHAYPPIRPPIFATSLFRYLKHVLIAMPLQLSSPYRYQCVLHHLEPEYLRVHNRHDLGQLGPGSRWDGHGDDGPIPS